MEHRAVDAVTPERLEGGHRRPVRRVEDDGQVEAPRQIEKAGEPPAAARQDLGGVRGLAQAVPRQPDLAEGDQPRVIRRHLRFHQLEVIVGELEPVGVEAHGRPHALAVGSGQLQGARVGLPVAPDGDRPPHVVLGRPRQGAAHVLERRVVQVTVAIDDHVMFILNMSFILNMPFGMLTVGETVRAIRAEAGRRSPTSSLMTFGILGFFFPGAPVTVMRRSARRGRMCGRERPGGCRRSIPEHLPGRLPAMVTSTDS